MKMVFAASWAPATSVIIASGYGRFLSFLAGTGNLDPTAFPAERITRPRVEAYVPHLRERNHSSTVAARILQLTEAARIMAPGEDWTWRRGMQVCLRRMSTPARDDRARLVPAATIIELVFELLRRAEAAEGPSTCRRALLYRDGLMIAVLSVCSLRAKNMAGMEIGTSLQRRGTEWWIAFSGTAMKNKRPYEAPLPGLTSLIDHYVEHHRLCLVGRSPTPIAGTAFWISSTGKPLTAEQVGQLVSWRTERELRRNLNPHLFRKLIPTELAINDPEHVGIAQPLLGHADYRTTQRTYNLGRALDAARRHQLVMQSIRDGSKTSPKPMKRPRLAKCPTARPHRTGLRSRKSSKQR